MKHDETVEEHLRRIEINPEILIKVLQWKEDAEKFNELKSKMEKSGVDLEKVLTMFDDSVAQAILIRERLKKLDWMGLQDCLHWDIEDDLDYEKSLNHIKQKILGGEK